jgi:hypothetical protein
MRTKESCKKWDRSCMNPDGFKPSLGGHRAAIIGFQAFMVHVSVIGRWLAASICKLALEHFWRDHAPFEIKSSSSKLQDHS